MTLTRTIASADGVPIAYDVLGDAPDTLVFIHGWTCNRSHWANQVREFSDRYRIIVIDLAGHGESGLGRTEWTMSAFAGDVIAVLDQERVDRAVLVGHSMGGMVIVHATQRLGKRVVGLVGADTFKYLRDNPPEGWQAELLQRLNNDFESAMTGLVGSMFSDNIPESVRKNISDGMLATPRAVALGAIGAMASDIPLFDTVAALDIPKFTINAASRPTDEQAVRDAGIEIRFTEGEGHFVMNEHPETFNQYLTEALAQISRP